MNLFIHTLTAFPEIYFFDGGEYKTHQTVEKNNGFADICAQHCIAEEIENIFYISGPASFTGLRNISVFLKTLQAFGNENIQFYSLSSFELFELCFPDQLEYVFPTGRTECFIGTSKKYIQKKQRDLSELEKLCIVEINAKNIQEIFPYLWANKSKYKTKNIHIEYGADPRIG